MPRRSWDEISHPREGFHFSDLTPERQAAAHSAMESLGGSNADLVRSTVHAELSATQQKIGALEASGKSVPSRAYRQLHVLKQGAQEAESLPATGMEQSVKTIRDTAMMPIKAVRQHAKDNPDAPLMGVGAGEFYPERRKIGQRIGDKVFGKGTEESYRLQVASPVLSARMAPQKEVNAAAGMAQVLKGGEDIGISLGHVAARYLSQEFRGSGNRPPIEAGNYNFADLARSRPDAAAMLLQHGANQQGIVVPTGKDEPTSAKIAQQQALSGQSGAQIHIPDMLEAPTGAFVSGYGITGHPKGARALQRFHSDPSEFGGFDFHKIPSYTWNINSGNQVMNTGTHHFLGAMAHGDKWFALHPEAEGHIRRAAAHPGWHDPTSTIDVWSGRAASGLPYHVARGLGERTNPEDIMGYLGAGQHRFNRQPGGLGKASDIGYLYGEEAHRRAGAAMQVKLPGGGRVAMPGHVAQSLSWYGIQAQEYPGKIKSGEKTLTPSSMQDPRSLNPLRMPRV